MNLLSFTFPVLKEGCILEYRYRTTIRFGLKGFCYKCSETQFMNAKKNRNPTHIVADFFIHSLPSLQPKSKYLCTTF